MEEIKIQKFFTDCGVMSRRAAENEIKLGHVKINGVTAEIGQRIDPEHDAVTYKGKKVLPLREEKVYILLNKPRGFVTTMNDEKGRRTVAELVSSLGQRVYPVGRLDMDSDGLLIMTNDGELTNILTHPKHEIPKIYEVTVAGKVTPEIISALSAPMTIDGYEIQPVKTELISFDGQNSTLKMTLFEGRNRQIRKMCDTQSLKIKRLCRVAIGNITLGELKVGGFRLLTNKEVRYLTEHSQQKG